MLTVFKFIISLFNSGLGKKTLKVLLIGLGVGGLVYFTYQYGGNQREETLKKDYELKATQNQVTYLDEIHRLQGKVSELEQLRDKQIEVINQTREEVNHEIDDYRSALISKYGDDGVSDTQTYSETGKTVQRLSHLPDAAKTPLAKPHLDTRWLFSAKDRQFIIDEATRADKINNELTQCKTFINTLYQHHEQYLEKVRTFK